MVRMTAVTCGCRFDAARMASAWAVSACFNGVSADDAINASSSARELSFERFGAPSAVIPVVLNSEVSSKVVTRTLFVPFISLII